MDGAFTVLKQFLDSSLEHVSNKSAFLCGVMKTYRQKMKVPSNPSSSTAAATKGPDEDKIKVCFHIISGILVYCKCYLFCAMKNMCYMCLFHISDHSGQNWLHSWCYYRPKKVWGATTQLDWTSSWKWLWSKGTLSLHEFNFGLLINIRSLVSNL